MIEKMIGVEGMSCGHCVETIEKVVGGRQGIERVSVDLEQKQVSVKFDENLVNLQNIGDWITEAGFEVLK